MSGSIAYEVTVSFDDPGEADRFEAWMVERHLTDILATGCFTGAELARVSPHRLRTRFLTTDDARLDRYLREHAPRLRDDFAVRFPKGTSVTREVWRAVQTVELDSRS